MTKISALTHRIQPAVIMQAFVGLVFLLIGSLAIAGGYNKHGYGMHGHKAKHDIVETAAKAGSFDTLLTAAKAAGLVDTLKGDGPYTLFAPTDEAFARIPADDLNALLMDKEALTKVLTNHLIRGKVTANEVARLDSAQTVAGQSVTISSNYGVKVNDAKVIKTDIMASNGIIHVVDKVIMPN
jgi:uncharacterized surface protein with fasciclin (FAS1) repeats